VGAVPDTATTRSTVDAFFSAVPLWLACISTTGAARVSIFGRYLLFVAHDPRGRHVLSQCCNRARKRAFKVGDRVKILLQGEPGEFRVSGIVRFGPVDGRVEQASVAYSGLTRYPYPSAEGPSGAILSLSTDPPSEEESSVRVVPAAVAFAAAAIAMAACQAGGQHGAAPERGPSTLVGHDNGISVLPAKEIARRAGRAINNVPVHVRGTAADGSSQVTALDVVAGRLDDARCTVVEAGEIIDAVRLDGKDYVRAPARVWMSLGLPAISSAAAAARVDGKYVRVAMRSPELGRLTKFLDVRRVLGDELAATETATMGGTAVINGVPNVAVIPVTPGLSPLPIGTIYVATVGEPYVIRWVSPGDVGSLDFSDYTKPVAVNAPPADKVIDLGALQAPA
jgi:hypothetical protein